LARPAYPHPRSGRLEASSPALIQRCAWIVKCPPSFQGLLAKGVRRCPRRPDADPADDPEARRFQGPSNACGAECSRSPGGSRHDRCHRDHTAAPGLQGTHGGRFLLPAGCTDSERTRTRLPRRLRRASPLAFALPVWGRTVCARDSLLVRALMMPRIRAYVKH
jgi:hypothetical protein